jgi:hypothetical protein
MLSKETKKIKREAKETYTFLHCTRRGVNVMYTEKKASKTEGL